MPPISRLMRWTLAPAAALALAACTPPAAEWSPSERDRQGHVASSFSAVVVNAAADAPTDASLAHLDAHLARADAPERLWVSLRPHTDAGARIAETIADHLITRGVRADKLTRAGKRAAGDNTGDLTVVLERWSVSLPSCPDWTRANTLTNNNEASSNFGCATRRNLMEMVADPRDLVRGRGLGAPDADRSTGAVRRYRSNEVAPLPGGTTTQ